jgi:glycosyltransferase involved in cell wall biosynthesis
MKLSIIIPIYNEEKTIQNIISAISKADALGLEKEIILVDDCSRDKSREILKKYEKIHTVIYHKNNLGKGGALQSGFKRAVGDIIIIQDADLEYDPSEYPKLLKPILDDKADVVFGSRFIGGQAHRVLYFWHTIMNKFLTFLSNAFSDLNLTDMETCYKVFRKKVLDQITIEEKRFGFEPEITAKIGELSRAQNVRVYEVGISYYGRTYEEGKKIGWKDGMRALWCVFKYNTSHFAHFIKYGLNGILIALSQILIIGILVEIFNFNTRYLKNTANIASIILGLLIAFILHSKVTWRYKFRSNIDIFKKLALFYIISIISIAIRVLTFYFFDKNGMDYKTNVLIGIILVIIMNFFGYDKLIFNKLKINKCP